MAPLADAVFFDVSAAAFSPVSAEAVDGEAVEAVVLGEAAELEVVPVCEEELEVLGAGLVAMCRVVLLSV